MRNKPKWHSILFIGLVFLLASLIVGCGSSTNSSSNDESLVKEEITKDEVISSFYNIARQQALPEREDIARWWPIYLPLAEVKYIKENDTYEISLPNFGDEGMEIWGIDMKSSRIWPKNAGALLSAIALFCHDRNDQRLDCQLWFAQLDALVQEMEK